MLEFDKFGFLVPYDVILKRWKAIFGSMSKEQNSIWNYSIC
jgi:hypothetical protein